MPKQKSTQPRPKALYRVKNWSEYDKALVRRGLRLLGQAIDAFEGFVTALGHDMYFVEPLYYHNAVIFERYGFTYQVGKRLMESIHAGFQPGGDLYAHLDGSSPFRKPDAANSIRKRSWAIHDGILGEPFTNVTMYKRIGRSAGGQHDAGLRVVRGWDCYFEILKSKSLPWGEN